MGSGYRKPLYLLPFDHRHSYVAEMFQFTPPLTPEQHAAVTDSKQLIYEGFQAAIGNGVPKELAGILVDEEFGTAILRDATAQGYVTAMSTETSGSDEFEFEYGAEFADHLRDMAPTFAKALVRYNPQGDTALNERQTQRLRTLSDYCTGAGQLLMFELLVPATPAQLADVHGNAGEYDARTRPRLMVEVIQAMQAAGVEPDVWKIEGLDRREDCEKIVAAATAGGRSHVGCIVLGRGADEQKVLNWLEIAASVPGFIGFAVGRTTFWDALVALRDKTVTREAAAEKIAARYLEWIDVFETARLAAGQA